MGQPAAEPKEYTKEQRVAFRQEFALRRQRNLLTVLPGAALIIAVAAGGDRIGLPAEVRMVVAVALALVTFGLSFRSWRCPACNAYLGKSLNPVVCRHCDFTLRT